MNSIEQKLTPSAKEALENASKRFDTSILEEAFKMSLESESKGKEITMNEVLKAEEKLLSKSVKKGDKSKDFSSFALFVAALGVVIICIGIAMFDNYMGESTHKFYWFSFDDPYSIIVLIGVMLSFIALFCALLASHKDQISAILIESDRDMKTQEFINSWKKIEKIGNRIMNLGQDTSKQYPLSTIYDFLSKNVIPDKAIKLKDLLRVRNSIVHGQEKHVIINIDKCIEESNEIIKILNAFYKENTKSK